MSHPKRKVQETKMRMNSEGWGEEHVGGGKPGMIEMP